MRSKSLLRLCCCLTAILFVVSAVLPTQCNADTAAKVQSLMDGIVSYQLQKNSAESVQDWINGELTMNAGTASEWYILALSQSRSGYDFSAYVSALRAYLDGTNVTSAASRQKYALAFIGAGSSDPYITETLADSIGQQGIMSWVYGLHLLNNGYMSESYSAGEIVDTLLSLQLADGGWALTGTVSDVDVTAMTLQALAPYQAEHAAAIDRAVTLLSERQLDGGDFASYGVPNPESTAQVIVALSALDVDCLADERFQKNGNTLLDGIVKYCLSDGSFSHTEGGACNDNATMQVFYSLHAYTRQQNGWGAFYLLDQRNPAGLVAEPDAPAEPSVTEAPPQTDAPAVMPPEETQPVAETTIPAVSETAVSETVQTSTSVTTIVSTGTETTAAATSAYTAVTSVSTEPAAAETTESVSINAAPASSGGYKLWVGLLLAGMGGAVCLVLFLLKKRHPKNFLAVLVITAAGIVFVCLTDFRSAQDYYSGTAEHAENASGTVTLTIRCDTVAGKSDADHIPEDGVILEATEFAIAQGDTVFDVLTQAAQTHSIQMEYSGSPELAYVSGIGYLYELDFGDLSGWVYHVNGVSPSVSCGEYALSDGDAIEWLYTCDLGNDVK